MNAIKGWRTHILMGLILLTGVLDAWGALDLKSFLTGFGVPADKVSTVLIGIAMLGSAARIAIKRLQVPADPAVKP